MNLKFHEEWMSCIKDNVKLQDVVIPGTHDSGTYKMTRFARCQNGSLYKQYEYGIRYFDIRFHINRRGKLVFEHGILDGSDFEEGLADIKKMLDNNKTEFFIFKLHHPEHEYLIGKIGRKFPQEFKLVNSIFEKYIEPSKYAFTDFSDISDITVGDIRKSGKRYILNWDNPWIDNCVNTPIFDPWNPKIHGMKTDRFIDSSLEFFNEVPENCLFAYQTQRTPGVGTEEGLKNPDTLEHEVKMQYDKLINKIASDAEKLKKVNIISGDFMTDGHFKCNEILRLNLLKGNVSEQKKQTFAEMTKV